jgi:hypothetical protein
MKTPKLSTVTWITVVLTVLWCAWWLHDEPLMVIHFTDVDINSGDFRHRVCLCYEPIGSLPVKKSKISESPLSHEVRRLGIHVPAERAWRTAFEDGRKDVFVDYVYGSLVAMFDKMLWLLDETKTSDKERRVTLEKFMTSLRTRHAFVAQEHGYVLIQEICDKHGLDMFVPDFQEELRRSEFWGK